LVREYNTRKKKKGGDVLKTTAKQLYPWFVIYVRSELPGALFEGNSKELLTGPPVELIPSLPGETPKVLAEKTKAFRALVGDHVQKILKWNFVSYIDEMLQAKIDATAKKKDGVTTVTQSEKLNDAEDAGEGKGEECTLLITEGQSAQTMALRLIPTLEGGKRKWGVLPIRGKIANPAKMTLHQFSGNEEWKTIKAALGLIIGTDYSTPASRATLRYGRVMFLTDQDDDGLHIRALLLTIFVKLFRGLVTADVSNTFTFALNTAVGMDIRGGKVHTKYYSNPEIANASPISVALKGGFRKYLKGTGSHSPQETASYTREDLKIVSYYLDEGGEETLMMVMAEKPGPRKVWVKNVVMPGIGSPYDFRVEGELGVKEFVDTQLSVFAATALERGIPSVHDLLKVSQRQGLHGMFRYQFPKDQTVVIDELGGPIKTDVGYHHGIISLLNTIIGMCQGFVGSNNLPPFINGGECGTRLLNGKDAASPRYAMAAVEKVTRSIYRVEDEPILRMRISDDRKSYLEPFEFRPVVPPCNGAEGMAIGWSTNVPNLSPIQAVEWVRAWLAEEERPVMVPWYRGFTGPVRLMKSVRATSGRLVSREEWVPGDEEAPDSFETRGVLRKIHAAKGRAQATTWEITELPIGLSTTKAKDHLESMATIKTTAKGKVPPRISNVVDKSPTPDRVWFTFKETKDFTPDIATKGNMDWLVKSHSLRNMVLLDAKGYPKKYEKIDDILEEWCFYRYQAYEARRVWWIKRWTALKLRTDNKLKTIRLVAAGKLDLRLPAAQVDAALAKAGVKKLRPIQDYTKPPPEEEVEATYDYVLSMQLRSMNAERIKELEKESAKFSDLIADYTATDSTQMWLRELDEFLVAYEQFLKLRKD
jgi:DNA topoisomerase-2